VVDYLDSTDLEGMARNITQQEEVAEALQAAQSSKNETAYLDNKTNTDEYGDLLARLQLELNNTEEVQDLGCEDVGDCLVLAVSQMAELFGDVLLSDFATLQNDAVNMTTVAKQLTTNNLTLEDAYALVEPLLHWVNETMHQEVWCGEVPRFGSDLANHTEVFSEREVRYVCNATGLPEPRYYWYRSPEDTNIFFEGKELVFPDTRRENSGTYYCVAANHMQRVRSSDATLRVLTGQTAEIVVRYAFDVNDFRLHVEPNNTHAFGVAVRVAVEGLLDIPAERVTEFSLSENGLVSHSFSPAAPNSTELTPEALSIEMLNEIRYGQFSVSFNDTFLYPVPSTFRRDFCRVPCQALKENSVYGAACLPAGGTSCPSGYLFQQGASSVCRSSHEFSGFDGVAYCRRENDPPYDITFLGMPSIPELSPAFTVIGNITARDTDAAQTVRFSVVAGGNLFAVDAESGEVKTLTVPNYEVANRLSFTVRATDDNGYYTDRVVLLQVEDVNEAPTDIRTLAAPLVRENSRSGTLVALFATLSEEKQTYTYHLSGPGAPYFMFLGNQLLTSAVKVNFETHPTVTVTVTSLDNGVPPLSLSKNFTVVVQDANDIPTLSYECVPAFCAGVNESVPADTVVGQVVPYDEDAGQTVRVSVLTDGSSGRLKLGADGKSVVLAAPVNPHLPFRLYLRVRGTDNGSPQGLSDPLEVELLNLAETTTTTSTTTTSTSSTSSTSTVTTTSSTSSTSTTTSFNGTIVTTTTSTSTS
jgi:predicted component of type VI protein secretion system